MFLFIREVKYYLNGRGLTHNILLNEMKRRISLEVNDLRSNVKVFTLNGIIMNINSKKII